MGWIGRCSLLGNRPLEKSTRASLSCCKPSLDSFAHCSSSSLLLLLLARLVPLLSSVTQQTVSGAEPHELRSICLLWQFGIFSAPDLSPLLLLIPFLVPFPGLIIPQWIINTPPPEPRSPLSTTAPPHHSPPALPAATAKHSNGRRLLSPPSRTQFLKLEKIEHWRRNV